MKKTPNMRGGLKALFCGLGLLTVIGLADRASAAPTISNVWENLISIGPYGRGPGLTDTLYIDVQFTESITNYNDLGGAAVPTLSLALSPAAKPAICIGPDPFDDKVLIFEYVVQPGDFASNLNNAATFAFKRNSAIITGPSGSITATQLSVPAAGALNTNSPNITVRTVDFVGTPTATLAEGASATWTVSRDLLATWTDPLNAMTLAVSASTPGILSAPTTLTIPINTLQASMTVTGLVAGTTTVRLRPTGYPGSGAGDLVVPVTVTAVPRTFTITGPATPVIEGSVDSLTVTLSAPAAAPFNIILTNDNPTAMIFSGTNKSTFTVAFNTGNTSKSVTITALDGGVTVPLGAQATITGGDPAGVYALSGAGAVVQIDNKDPIILNQTPPAGDLGNIEAYAPVSFTLAGTDVLADRTNNLVAIWTFGDGTTATSVCDVVTGNATATHSYTNLGFMSLTVSLTDKDGASVAGGGYTLTVTPATPATFTITGPAAMAEGSSGFLSVTLSRPPFSGSVTVTLANGNPAKMTYPGASAVTFTKGAAAPYEVGPLTIPVNALDGDAVVTNTGVASPPSFTMASEAVVTITNVNPSITSPSPAPVALGDKGEGTTLNFLLTANDVQPDKLTGLTAIWDFGDGTSATSTCNSVGMTSATHAYDTPGAMNVVVNLFDKDGGFTSATLYTVNVVPSTKVIVKVIGRQDSGGQPLFYNGLHDGLGDGEIGAVSESANSTNRLPDGFTWVYKFDPTDKMTVLYVLTNKQVWVDYNLNLVEDPGERCDSFFHVYQGDGFINALATVPIAYGSQGLNLNGEDRDVNAVFSREYFTQDNYGDIDLDQLPDLWEELYGFDFEFPNETENPDDDHLPAACNANMDYPLPDGGSYAATGPGFHNRFEVRGLATGLNARVSIPVPPQDEPRRAGDPREWYGTDPTNPDTDGDGFSDGWEYYFWMNAQVRGIVGEAYDPNDTLVGTAIPSGVIAADFNPLVSTPDADTDEDGLSNAEEYELGTNPIDWDTDGDYMADGWEVLRDPTGVELDPMVSDGGGNSDEDYLAVDRGTDITALPPPLFPLLINPGSTPPYLGNVHYFVYLTWNFDPRTGWAGTYIDRTRSAGFFTPNTLEYRNVDEYGLMRFRIDNGIIASAPIEDWPEISTDPLSADTDGDGSADGWELYVFLDPNDGLDALPDYDLDFITHPQEFCGQETIAQYPGLAVPATLLGESYAEYYNKFWPCDPWNADTDGDRLGDGFEGIFFCANLSYVNVPPENDIAGKSTAYIRGSRMGGMLNPCCCDTDFDYLPDFQEAQYSFGRVIDSFGNPVGGQDGTMYDSQSMETDIVNGNWQNYDYDADGLENYQEYLINAMYHFQYDKWSPGQGATGYAMTDLFLGYPYFWDWSIAANYWQISPVEGDPQPFHFPYYFILPEPRPMVLRYACSDPSQWDTDGDGLDDFYEMFHSLNPGWSEMNDPERDVVNKGPPPRVPDIRIQPWTAGEALSDPDQDGLPNWEEGLFPERPYPANYHSDPSPLWVSDISYDESWVNLYYQWHEMPWYWSTNIINYPTYPYPAFMMYFAAPPRYLYNFESDEGYDTDNDNLQDKQELISSTQPGATDPLYFDDPRFRKAARFNGDAAMRTQFGSVHGVNMLRSWTVEIWARADEPISPTGQRQVIVERPVQLLGTDPMPAPEFVRRNFRIGIEPDGTPFAEYNNSGNDVLTETVNAPMWVMTPGRWYHLAAVLDGRNSRMTLYVNGKKAAEKPTRLIPCTGIIDGAPPLYLPAPIVVGSADANPSGVIWYSNPSPELTLFFNGWADELRVWDGVRTWDQVKETMNVRFDMDDVTTSMTNYTFVVNQILRNVPPGMYYDVGTNELPAYVLYHYTFDNIPDPTLEPIVPRSFDLLNGRPADASYPGIPWWWQHPDRSQVYSDYKFVQWAENTASHVPAILEYDVFGTLINVNFDLAIDSKYWIKNAPPGNFRFYNKSNPYHLLYNTGYIIGLDGYWLPSDLLPLRFARTDLEVPLWDGGLPGTASFDTDGDGMADWWEVKYGLDPFDPTGRNGRDFDIDGDGLINYFEYLVNADPTRIDSFDPSGVMTDDLWDSDGDGLGNLDEVQLLGTNPALVDTDDDGYWDGAELDVTQPATTDAFGVSAGITGPFDSHSPEVPRSLMLAGNQFEAPDRTRFQFLTAAVAGGPTVTITAPASNAQIAVRFTDVTGTVRSPLPIASTRLYVNGDFVAALTLDALNAFTYTTIIRSGLNEIKVVAVDQEGGVGEATVNVTGTFAAADIRVTQIWDRPGDLDTWLVDPLGRHMGWTPGGPGLPADAGPGQRIPGAFLDIDDIMGVGPENITVIRGSAVNGDYPVWMNNYGNRAAPNSTVRVLVHEGQPNEKYVEFGPQPMPVPDGNGNNGAAWWNTTTISWPSGDMAPPGTPVGGEVDPEDPGAGIGADVGWTVEGWVKPGDDSQSGALAVYRHIDNNAELFLVGLSNNCPVVRVMAASSAYRQYVLLANPLPANRWTHIAAVFSESQKSLRLHVDGVLTAAVFMPESRLKLEGRLFVDADFDGAFFSNALADELRFWDRARNGGLISAQKHTIIDNAKSLIAAYSFDDGGLGIEDSAFALDRSHDLALGGITVLTDSDANGHNDYVTADDAALVFGLRDRDDDGMPDWFEFTFSGSDTALEPAKDDDTDGLNNLYEYLCGTNPLDVDTDRDGVRDALEDFDGDGLNNLAEQDAGSDPRYRDTDDDGLPDNWEAAYGSDPADPLSPAKTRALQLDGSADSFVRVPQSTRFDLLGFDMGAWVYLTNTPPAQGAAEIIVREVQPGVYNYRLGIDGQRRPFITFTASDLTTNVTLFAPDFRALPLNIWTHVRAQFDAVAGTLQVILNGEPVAFVNTSKRPAQNGLGPIDTLIGRGLDGYIDTVMIKGSPETVLDYRFDDDTSDQGTPDCGTSGTFGVLKRAWHYGQINDFAAANSNNWSVRWIDAGSLEGGARIIKLREDDWVPITGSLTDTDRDGLPDVWEVANGYNPLVADTDGDGVPDAADDDDLDGLVNMYEYLSGTNPHDPDSDDNTVLDRDEDSDDDGLSNLLEQVYGSDPSRPDTDDDGILDGAEVAQDADGFTLPNASLSPARSGALSIAADGQYALAPDQARLHLPASWTVEAWVNLATNFDGTGMIVRRQVGSTVNYELGIEAGKPYVRYIGTYGVTLYPQTTLAPTALGRRNHWYHLAGVYDHDRGELRLYVDGVCVQWNNVMAEPGAYSAGGVVATRFGEDFRGLIDEVRIWNAPATAAMLGIGAYRTYEHVLTGPVLYYRFDDFGTTVEDFAMPPRDWERNWENAATLYNGATVAAVGLDSPIPPTQFVDEDTDEIPDFWEIGTFGSIIACAATADPDEDGLDNLNEYRARLHPRLAATFRDSILDGERDFDNDGLFNAFEQEMGTLPDVADTDDDTFSDFEELTGLTKTGVPLGISSPLNSLDPVQPRGLKLDGTGRVVVPPQGRHALQEWTLSAWVRPSAANNGGIVLARTFADGTVNYELGVETDNGTNRPYARYHSRLAGVSQEIKVARSVAASTLVNEPTGDFLRTPQAVWTHLAATYSVSNQILSLYVDGEWVASRTDAVNLPDTGSGPGLPLAGVLTIGGGSVSAAGAVTNGFEGEIDDVRISALVSSAADIRQMARGGLVIEGGEGSTNAVAIASQAAPTAFLPQVVPDEYLVGVKSAFAAAEMQTALKNAGFEVLRAYNIVKAFHVKAPIGAASSNALAQMRADARIAYIEPNYRRKFLETLPNDTRFGDLWGLKNTGQSGGVDGADIDAGLAWDTSTGGDNVIVAIIDTGIDYNHEDLKDNMWTNPGEIPGNNTDDDGNGYVDDVYGYDFGAGDPDPMDDLIGHGTHCSGTIGAVGNNVLGVCGVNWKVKLMACKVADNAGGLNDAAAIAAIDYAWKMGARVSNNSWGGPGFSQTLYDAIQRAMMNDHLFVAAAGNDGTDNDSLPLYPGSYDLDNIIAVAATDRRDELAGFSCYGATSVDIGAPGVDIMSTLPTAGSQMGTLYGLSDGTSMATPHVAGAAALILSVDNRLSYSALKTAILGNADPIPALNGKCVTGGRLNIGNAIPKDSGGGGGGTVVVRTLAAWFRFDDGGKWVQDFTLAADWRRDWRFAGRKEGGAVVTNYPFAWLPTGDSDGDGLPDWWEEANGLDPRSAVDDDGADADPDGDGLRNLFEYLASMGAFMRNQRGLSPWQADTDNDGVSDALEDSDNDTIANLHEQEIYWTDPGDADCDDDGINDGVELTGVTDPTDSASPPVARVLNFGGGPAASNTVVVSDKVNMEFTSRHSSPVWTIELWVKPASTQTGVYPLMSRRTYATNRRNFEIGLSNGVPYAAFDASENGIAVVRGLSPTRTLTAGEWAHLAARFDPGEDGETQGILTLFVNGAVAEVLRTGWHCAVGPGDLTFGSAGFTGQISQVRIWKVAIPDDQIAGTINSDLISGSVTEMAGYLNVPGSGHLKETATTVKPNGEYIDVLRQNWTLECWVRTTGAGGRLILRRNQSARTDEDFNYYLGISPNGALIGRFAMDYTYVIMTPAGPALVYVRDFILNNITGEIPVNDGQWHHVAYVRSNSGCSLFVDGLLDTTQARIIWPIDVPPPAMVIPPAVYAAPGPCIFGEDLDGDMDEIRIWNRGLPTAELRDVGGRNLSGNELGLISYFNFDFQLGKTADERSALRDPVSEYGIYIPLANRVVGTMNGPPIVYDPLLAVQGVALSGMFLGNDGGVLVEDRTHRLGLVPFNAKPFAGRKGDNVTWVNVTPWMTPPGSDSDHDGMSDEWEIANGYDPNNSDEDRNGILDGWDDWDHDELPNYSEELADTNPRDPDTDNDGIGDFSDGSAGFLYSDHDFVEDWWETQFSDYYASPRYYDAHMDRDNDGWDNWSECRVMVSNSVANSAEYPLPEVTATFRYTGIQRGGQLVILAYNSAAMNGEPIAVLTATAPGAFPAVMTTLDATNGLVLAGGHLRQGDHWMFAFMDLDGSLTWNDGEPASLGDDFPYQVGWHKNEISFGLADTARGFARLEWPADDLDHKVTIYRGAIKVFEKVIQAPRNWLHEGDIIDAGALFGGGNMGLDWNNIGTALSVAYDWKLDDGAKVGSFTNFFSSSLNVPAAVYPASGAVLRSARPEFRWTMTNEATAFSLQVFTGPSSFPTVYFDSGVVRAPGRGVGNECVWKLPVHLLDRMNYSGLTWSDGAYSWRVKAYSPKVIAGTSWSTTETLNADAAPTIFGYGAIKVEVKFYGTLSGSDRIKVQAHRSASFNGIPDGQMNLTGAGTVTLNGLKANVSYYVCAFHDQNSNNRREPWEAWGYVRTDTDPKWPFTPRVISSDYQTLALYHLTIVEADTDQDGIGDATEFAWNGTAGTDWLKVSGMTASGAMTDLDNDTLDDRQEFLDGTNAKSADTDGDGIDDALESKTGLSANTANALLIAGVSGEPTAFSLQWTWSGIAAPPGGATPLAEGGAPVVKLGQSLTYVIERTSSLTSPNWTEVARFTSEYSGSNVSLPIGEGESLGFFRLRMLTE